MTDEVRDRLDIIEVTNRIALLADLREWNELRECFCDQVEVDYTSEFGGQPQHLTAAELLEQWNFLKEFQATQHQVTCHTITLHGDHADCRAHVQATHYLPNDHGESFWMCGGHYEYGLQHTAHGWRVERMKFILTWARGNQTINHMAQQRAQEKRSLVETR